MVNRYPSLTLIDILRSRSSIFFARAHRYSSLALIDILRSRSCEEFPRVGDAPGDGRGGDGVGRGEVDLALLRAHAAGEVPVGGRDADLCAIDATERVPRAAEAGRAGG